MGKREIDSEKEREKEKGKGRGSVGKSERVGLKLVFGTTRRDWREKEIDK